MVIDSNAPFCLTAKQLDRLDADAEARRRDKADAEKPIASLHGSIVAVSRSAILAKKIAADEAEGEKFTARYNGKQDTAYTR